MKKLYGNVSLTNFPFQQSKIYEVSKNALTTANTPKFMYGAYNEANAKLVTAEGDYPSNYEHYSGFEPRSQKKRTGILKGIILHGRVLLLGQQSFSYLLLRLA